MPLCNMLRSHRKENEDINQQFRVARNAGPIDRFEKHVDRISELLYLLYAVGIKETIAGWSPSFTD